MQTIQLVEIEQIEHFVNGNVAEHACSPERWIRNWIVGSDVASRAGVVADCNVFADGRLKENIVACIVEIFVDEHIALFWILKNVHRLQSLECVFAVENSGVVCALVFDE